MRHLRYALFLSLGLIFAFAPSPSWARRAPDSFADLAEKLLPSVVNISTSQTIDMRGDVAEMPEFQFPPGSPFEDFFQEFFEKQGRGKEGDENYSRKHKTTSLGSGFIVDKSGYVVTNYHVVQDADEITVILQDDTNIPAKVVGRDKKTDLALLKVETKKELVALDWGNSDRVRVGDWILAIGNPFGLGGTVTAGIISARARDINSGPYDDYLQTDAPINRGNSGGPMFDMDGNVIGVNTAIFSPSGGSVGIGFAIPSSMAKNVIEQLKKTGHTRRGWLGVKIQLVTKEIAESLGLDKAKGALVSSVTKDSPAEKAELKAGDVIVQFNNKKVDEMRRLPRMVAETPVEESVPLSVFRDGKEITLKVKIGELKGDEENEEKKTNEDKKLSRSDSTKIDELGLNVTAISKTLRERYEISKDTNGLVVLRVLSNGVGAEYGIRMGDVITEANQKNLRKIDDLTKVIEQSKKDKKPVLFLVDRRGDLRFVAINFNKKK